MLIYYDGADALGATPANRPMWSGGFCRWGFQWGINLGFLAGYRLERHPVPRALWLIWWDVKGSVGIPDSYAFSRSEHIDWRRGARGRWRDKAASQPNCLPMVALDC